MKLQNGLSDRRKHTLYLMVFALCDRDIAALTARLKLCGKALCPVLLDNSEISRVIRKHGARMMEVNPTYSTVLQAGLTEDITDLYEQFNRFRCILQYTRSGHIAVTRSFDEPVTDYLNKHQE